jgi:hypothetical protein
MESDGERDDHGVRISGQWAVGSGQKRYGKLRVKASGRR